MLKKAGIVFAGVASLFMIGGTGMASAGEVEGHDFAPGAREIVHKDAVIGVDQVSVADGAAANALQCVSVAKPQIPVAVGLVAVAAAVQDVKPNVGLPEINVLGGHNGDTTTSTVINEQTGNNSCAGGNGNGAGGNEDSDGAGTVGISEAPGVAIANLTGEDNG
ncbi:hypothetical protein AB0I60_06020 [Actinosynnema sp. NPDC050436]|uniref:hypothetical protein n=1 Tax=Actinosynnema sp. NPDC050436 TaxID=3155659 RepID=UPI0033D80C58